MLYKFFAKILTKHKLMFYNVTKIHLLKGNLIMQFNRDSYREFNCKEEALAWGKEHYSDWMPKLQNQDYKPQTPAEVFFRRYTQGSPTAFNRILRDVGVDKYDFEDSGVTKEMFIDGIAEINKHSLCENIIVHRYVDIDVLHDMKKWSNVKLIRHNSILTDKGFFSTTLSLDSVDGKHYATLKRHSLFYIYVPKGTHCVYVDLIADMNENEIIFAPNIKLKVLGSYWFGRYIECVVVNN